MYEVVYVDGMEWYFVGEVCGYYYYLGDLEEDDVEVGDEY